VYLACRRALPHLKASGAGAILNTASQSALQGQAMNEAYCAAKAGVVLLTRSLARELAPLGIRLNCSAGGTDTPLLRRYTETPRRVPVALASRSPMGRLARPEGDRGRRALPRVRRGLVRDRRRLPVDGDATA